LLFLLLTYETLNAVIRILGGIRFTLGLFDM